MRILGDTSPETQSRPRMVKDQTCNPERKLSMPNIDDFAADLTETEMRRAMEEAGAIVKDLERDGTPTVAGLTLALATVIEETSENWADFERSIGTAVSILKHHAEEKLKSLEEIDKAAQRLLEKGLVEMRVIDGVKHYRATAKGRRAKPESTED